MDTLNRTGKVQTSDGVELHYDVHNEASSTTVVLIHGWSGSRHYWDLNVNTLATECKVVTYDQRFHGSSDKPTHGFHVARLAADLRNVLEQLDIRDAVVVGSSMGASVIWSYVELFGLEDGRIRKCVFVDQAPLQNRSDDWNLGSTGCYDIASLTRLQCSLMMDFPGFARANAEFCLCDSSGISPSVLTLLEEETLKADKRALAKLMADHTALDWRPVLPRITVPCLNVVGRQSAVFPWEGVAAVSEFLSGAASVDTVIFEDCNHWLYIEDSERFNRALLDFVN
jgi:non-heme chloroperoxidase